jgi:glycosyltransferase involved in cell wall biosynthesis
MPRVSVIIPTSNRRALVQQAIDSVLAQTYTDYESIVVDVWTVTVGAIKRNAPR